MSANCFPVLEGIHYLHIYWLLKTFYFFSWLCIPCSSQCVLKNRFIYVYKPVFTWCNDFFCLVLDGGVIFFISVSLDCCCCFLMKNLSELFVSLTKHLLGHKFSTEKRNTEPVAIWQHCSKQKKTFFGPKFYYFYLIFIWMNEWINMYPASTNVYL